MPTTSAYCGIAPMKKPECEFVVVPVLPMIGRLPRPAAAAVPVPSTVVISIAYCTCESSCALVSGFDGSSTPCVSTDGSCCGPLGSCQYLMTCPAWYTP